ncbi:hypothetical protein [Helicovermis profundi]|uniref:MotA/TolQ/ExbB proton channel domain-containing protein n=1 Tax=Helicovermis profundi TaxID=3065157 RepID=A0AAU9ECC0_9FIRM|nr:hypothetical protein HLPR_05480 [Clostridia bacterium S502]
MLNLLSRLNPIAYAIIIAILTILFITIILSLSIRSKYKKILKDITNTNFRKEKKFDSPMLNEIIEDFKDSIKENISEVNTEAMIEKNIHKYLKNELIGERFVNKSTSLMIILGLLGTFYGLTLSIGNIVNLLSTTENAATGNVANITGGLINSVTGMSVAFVTSLFGIASSIIVNLISILFHLGEMRESIIIHIEEYLDNNLGKKSLDLETVDEEGKSVLEVSFENLGTNLEVSLNELTSTLAYRLTEATKEMKNTAETIGSSIDKFDKSLDVFGENVRDFSEFNYHLKNNIERMSLVFDDNALEIKNHTSVLKNGFPIVKEFNEKVGEITSNNKES